MGFLHVRGKCARHADGFTLLETMIALGVSAVAMVAIMNVLSRQTLMQSSIQSRADMQDFVSEKRLALEVARDRLTAAGSQVKLWDLIKAVNFVPTNSGSVKPKDPVTWNIQAQHLDEEKRRKREPLTPTSRNDILVVEPANLAQPFWIPSAHNLPHLEDDSKLTTFGQLLQLPGGFTSNSPGVTVDRSRWINLTPPDLEPDAPDQLRRIRFTKWSVQLVPRGIVTLGIFEPEKSNSSGHPLYQAKLHFEADKALTRGPANSPGGTAELRVPGAQSMSADIDLGGQCEVDPQTGQVTCLAANAGTSGASPGSSPPPIPEARAFVVFHSQTDQAPDCPKDWEDLLGASGFSYLGSQIDNHSLASEDLGGMGSCITSPAFQDIPTLECTSGSDGCGFKTSNDVGFWLFNAKHAKKDQYEFNLKAPNSITMISRCRVCAKKNTSVVTIHSFSKRQPTCPSDHSEILWEGFSLKSTSTNNLDAVEISQNLAGTGSCLRNFLPIPFTECRGAFCHHNTDNDRAQWVYAPEGQSPQDRPVIYGTDLSKTLDHVSRCVVCATPPVP